MPPPIKTPARTLTERVWGQSWIEAIPLKWRSALKYLTVKTPGVDNSTIPDEIGGTDGVINSQVVTNRINELEKTTSRLDGGISQHHYHNQEYDDKFDVVTPTDEYLTTEGAELGLPRRQIDGLVPGVDQVKTISPNTTVLDNYKLLFPGITNLNSKLPDVLESIDGIYEFSTGEGFYSETGDAGFVPSGSASLAIRGSGVASAAIMPDVNIKIIPPFKPAVPTTRVIFFLPAPVTKAQVLTKLGVILGASVTSWSVFHPTPINVFVVGRRISLKADASAHWQRGGNSDGGSEFADSIGTGVSREVGLTIKVVRIPPTLHGAFAGTIISNSTGVDTSAYAAAGLNIADTGTISDSISGYAYATAAATTPTGYPSSGLFLLDSQAEPYRYGYVMIHAEVVDFAEI